MHEVLDEADCKETTFRDHFCATRPEAKQPKHGNQEQLLRTLLKCLGLRCRDPRTRFWPSIHIKASRWIGGLRVNFHPPFFCGKTEAGHEG